MMQFGARHGSAVCGECVCSDQAGAIHVKKAALSSAAKAHGSMAGRSDAQGDRVYSGLMMFRRGKRDQYWSAPLRTHLFSSVNCMKVVRSISDSHRKGRTSRSAFPFRCE